MKKIFCLIISVILIALVFAGCSKNGAGATKTVHCDKCGKEVEIAADSNMNDDWILYCKDCEKELGLDKIVE